MSKRASDAGRRARQLVKLLESSLELAELEDATTAFLIARALDKARAGVTPIRVLASCASCRQLKLAARPGVGFYEELDVRLLKEATGAADSDLVQFIAKHDLRSGLIIAHTRHATRGTRSYANAQPFVRELAGRVHLFAHNGDLPGIFGSAKFQCKRFSPVGETDSEHAFCVLLDRMASIWTGPNTMPTLRERLFIVSSFAGEIRALGPANFLYSDGEVLFAHGHRRKHADTGKVEAPGLVSLERQCPPGEKGVAATGISIRGDHQYVTFFASVPLTDEHWSPLAEGELVAVSRGQLVARQLATEPLVFADSSL